MTMTSTMRISPTSQAAMAFLGYYKDELDRLLGADIAEDIPPSADTLAIVHEAHRSVEPGAIRGLAVRAARHDAVEANELAYK